jgi:hypothetical protein
VVRQVLHSARELVRNAKEKRLKLEILRWRNRMQRHSSHDLFRGGGGYSLFVTRLDKYTANSSWQYTSLTNTFLPTLHRPQCVSQTLLSYISLYFVKYPPLRKNEREFLIVKRKRLDTKYDIGPWTRYWTFGFHKRREISWLAERLLASQVWIRSLIRTE